MWSKGVKCVCIKEPSPRMHEKAQRRGDVLPTLGQVLTVRDVSTSPKTGRLHLRFREIANKRVGGGEARFVAHWFRPLVDPKSLEEDLELFKPLLATKELEHGSV